MTCKRCGWTWESRTSEPKKCPSCFSPYWNKARVRAVTPKAKPVEPVPPEASVENLLGWLEDAPADEAKVSKETEYDTSGEFAQGETSLDQSMNQQRGRRGNKK